MHLRLKVGAHESKFMSYNAVIEFKNLFYASNLLKIALRR